MLFSEIANPEQNEQEVSDAVVQGWKQSEDSGKYLQHLPTEEPGIFDGVLEGTGKGLVYGFKQAKNALFGAVSGMVDTETMDADIEENTGIKTDFSIGRVTEQKAKNYLQDERANDKKNWGVNPETMGTVAQVVHGIFSTIPKAALYTMALGPTGGAVAFGADIGRNRYDELIDQGVDERTATGLGVMSGVLNAVGVRIPPALGASRLQSTLWGAGSNVGLNFAELASIKYTLDNQNYTELAKAYDFSVKDALVAGALGGFMGAAFFRKPKTAEELRTDREIKEENDYRSVLESRFGSFVNKEGKSIAPSEQTNGIADLISKLFSRGLNDYGVENKEALLPRIEQIRHVPIDKSGKYFYMDGKPIEKEPNFKLIEVARDENGVAHNVYGVNGNPNLTVFPEGIVGLKPLPLRLQEETMNGEHIAHHEKDLKGIGYESAKQAIWDISQNYTKVYQGKKNGEIVLVREFFYNDNGETKKGILYADAQEKYGIYRVGSVTGTTNSEYLKNRKLLLDTTLTNRLDQTSVRTRGFTGQEQSTDGEIVPFNDSLYTFHNISETNLNSSLDLGGFPVPSIGIGKASNVIDEYAEITLVGTKDIVDPHKGTPVYSADAYTPIFPPMDWSKSVVKAEAKKLSEDLSNVRKELGLSDSNSAYYFTWEMDPQKSVTNIVRELDGKAYFLKATGKDYKPVYKKAQEGKLGSMDDEIQSYVKAHPSADIDRNGDAVHKEVSDIFFNILSKRLDDMNRFAKRQWISRIEEYKKTGLFPYKEMWSFLHQAKQDSALIGKDIVDTRATQEKYDSLIDKKKIEEFYNKRIQAVFTKPKIKVGNRLVEFNLENVVKAMTREKTVGSNMGIVYGNGLVRAMLTKKFRSLEEVQSNRGRVVSKEASKNEYERISDLTEKWRDGVFRSHVDDNTFHALDSSMEVLAEVGKKKNPTADEIRRKLKEHGFTKGEISDEAIQAGLDAIKAIKEMHVPYFEAKPQRAVGLEEFAGAVVPKGTSPKTVQRLRDAGLEVREYSYDANDRADVTQTLLKDLNQQRGDVLYQRAAAERILGYFDPDNNLAAITEFGNISTICHEIGGHWFLNTVFKLKSTGHQNAQLDADVGTLLNAFGLKTVDDWNALGTDGQRKYQERFASWFELYLAEGKAPSNSLRDIFKKLAGWIADVYHEMTGQAPAEAIGERYSQEFGETLPKMAPEVKAIFDRIYNDRHSKPKRQPSNTQVAATRAALFARSKQVRNQLLTSKNSTPAERLDTQQASEDATLKAAQQLINGETVDTSAEASRMSVDPVTIETANKNFGRELVMGDSDTSTIVVLQNRDRSTVASQAQVNSIASNPIYGKLSMSRDSATGAPVVSYGKGIIDALPEDHLGRTDAIYESDGTEVPVQYAVMEASDVETSNALGGEWNERYGKDRFVNVVAGNGRMTGLKEAYRRNGAKGYKDALANDKSHGISPEVIQGMQEPVLVRIMRPEDVSTRFVEESNNSQVLAKNDVEMAHQDAPLIRSKMENYTFDEEGNPTADTVRMFLEDINDTNALGEYLTSDGRPNDKAVKRINSAVFYEAYRSDALTALFSDTDNNIRRVLNAMASLAPKVIQVRNMGIDIGPSLIEGANAIKSARDSGTFGKDMGEQLDMFGSEASLPFASVLTENANSGVAIRNILNKALDFARQSIEAQNDPLFPAPKIDVADVSKFVRDLQNDIRVAQGKAALPNVDTEAVRAQIKQMQETAQAIEKIAEVVQEEAKAVPDASVVDQMKSNSVSALDERTALDARVNDILLENPNETAKIMNENGDLLTLSAKEVIDMANAEVAKAENEALGIGQAVMCILENKGV